MSQPYKTPECQLFNNVLIDYFVKLENLNI